MRGKFFSSPPSPPLARRLSASLINAVDVFLSLRGKGKEACIPFTLWYVLLLLLSCVDQAIFFAIQCMHFRATPKFF